MTLRIYLAAARLDPGPPEPTDLPAERFFVHASEVPEIWVETETTVAPERGRAVAFALARPMDIGCNRVLGTVERVVAKQGVATDVISRAREPMVRPPYDISHESSLTHGNA